MFNNKEIVKIKEEKKIPKWLLEKYGTIKEVKDGVVIVKEGLNSVAMSEIVEFEKTGLKGIVTYLGMEKAITVLGNVSKIKVGDLVKRMHVLPYIDVNYNILGRVVDPLGNPLDGLGDIKAMKGGKRLLIEKKAPGIIERESVRNSLETGIKFLDSMIPIGLGQRELIIGDPKTGKTTIAIDTIINQKGKGLICVYVVIGQKQTSLLKILKTLKKKDCMKYTTIVMASAADSAVMQYLAPYSGCTVGEYFMSKGRDVLIVYDDLSKHAVAYRQMSLLLRRPPGREGYPGDVWATVRLYLCMFFINRNKKINNTNLKNLKLNYIFKRNYTKFNKFIIKTGQVKEGFDKMQDALKKYEYSSKLIYFDRVGNIFLMAGFFSWSLSILGISLVLSSFTLAKISLLEFLISFFINIYVYIKRLLYIYNYNLDCNPSLFAKLLAVNTATTRFGTKAIMVACGATVSSNYVICEITDVSIFKEYGKDLIYGDKTFSETTKSIYHKIKDGPKD